MHKTKLRLFIGLTGLSCYSFAQADDMSEAPDALGESSFVVPKTGFVYGVGLGLKQEIYSGYEQKTIPLPLFGYRGDKLNIIGPFITYRLAAFDHIAFSLAAAPRFDGFDEDDSDTFHGMSDRKWTMDLGISADVMYGGWHFNTNLMADTLGRSDGYAVNSKVSYRWDLGAIIIEPSISFEYQDKNLVDYYYGVRAEEATIERLEYHGQSTVNSGFGVSVSTPIFLGGMTRFGLESRFYGDGITDSPLTEQDMSVSMFFSFSKFF